MLQCSSTGSAMMMTMQLSNQELADYFARIGFSGTARRDEATLRQLHALHPQAIAFENLDSWRGQRVSLQPERVFRKLVHEGRGGYCFEQNQLFRRVLQTLGFTVQGLSARVLWMLPEDVVLPRTHMSLLVTLDDESWIADVGFGSMTMTAPLALDVEGAQATPHEPFRVRAEHGLYTVEAQLKDQWHPLYRVSLEPQLPADYETANWYVSTHPGSRFVNQLIASRPDAQGRHTLLDRRYTRHLPQQASTSSDVQSPQQLRELLQQQFGLASADLQAMHERIEALFTDTP